jgi:hypothetical protein
MHFERSVLNPVFVASICIGGLEKQTFDLRAQATPVVLTLEEAYSEPVSINVLKIRDISRLMLYIPYEHKYVYDETLESPVCNWDNDDN